MRISRGGCREMRASASDALSFPLHLPGLPLLSLLFYGEESLDRKE
jgi:hypothetical protein